MTAMTKKQRIKRLEKLVSQMADALCRKDTEQNGNWGWPAFHNEMTEIRDQLTDQPQSKIGGE